ncbi:MAG: hypothetical protein E7163_03525 [Firmicutes bacterium]|nr:hypothetical protein [Bacillota bacterium]
MDKIRDIKKYISVVEENNDFFKQYYYHSLIDLNLIKLDTILQYGILSKKLIEKNGLSNIYTHFSSDFDSKNGDMFVSLSEYTDDCSFNTMFESFTLHTLTSLSLLINKQIGVSKEGVRQTYFDDEIFCFQSVDKSKIEGIMLPEHLSNLTINQVNCLPNDLSCYTRSYINNWLKCTEEYFRQKIPRNYIDELKVSHEQLWNIIEEYESPEKWIESAIKTQRKEYGKDLKDVLGDILQYLWSLKYGIQNPKYLDIIKMINKQSLPIYEIKEKCLKKVN